MTTTPTTSTTPTFDTRAYKTTARGTRAYWAVTWLQSDTPNGEYQIERLSNQHWSVTHHQVLAQGRDKIVRFVGSADRKAKAVRLAELDNQNLQENVIAGLLKTETVNSITGRIGKSAS